MQDSHTYLCDLDTSSKNYNVEVQLIEKTRPKLWSRNGIPYQHLLFEDEKGFRMRGVLFGEQIGIYKDTFIYNGHYKISNAPIKCCRQEHPTSPANRKRVMVFNRLTDIQPLPIGSGPYQQSYLNISQIPKVFNTSNKYDVVGVVLFVEEKPYTISTHQGKHHSVRELAIMDHSTDEPLLITASHDLAYGACDFLISKAHKLHMVGFTALKTSIYKGFSMTTTMSTTFIHSPIGDNPNILADWLNRNQTKLIEMQEKILNSRCSFPNKYNTTIASLHTKKSYNLTHGEKYILNVTIPEPSLEKLHAYLGCSECDYVADTRPNDSFYCTNCSTDNVISVPRVNFTCQITDGTGNLTITASTTNAEKILHMPAPDIYRMKHTPLQEANAAFNSVKILLQTNPTTIVVAPATAPSIYTDVQWQLSSVESNYIQGRPQNTAETSSKQTDQMAETKTTDLAANTSETNICNNNAIQPKIEDTKKGNTYFANTASTHNNPTTQANTTSQFPKLAP